MSKSWKLAIVGAVYVIFTLFLLNSALTQLSKVPMMVAMRSGGGDGVFIMYGMAFVGLSAVAGVIAVLIAKGSEE